MKINFVVPVFKKIENEKIFCNEFDFFFVVDSSCDLQDQDFFLTKKENMTIFYTRWKLGQYGAIWEGLKLAPDDGIIIVCDYDRLEGVFKMVDKIAQLVSSGKVVFGLDTRKKREGISKFLAPVFYSIFSALVLDKIPSDKIPYITSFSAFPSELRKEILKYDFHIYLFALFICAKEIVFMDIVENSSVSSYSFFKLLELSFFAFLDLFRFIKQFSNTLQRNN